MAKSEGGPALKEAGPIPEMKHQKEGVLYIGMDLGCYKTSVAATNGTRETVYSIVGWPKDPVSRKMLGKDIVFGNEAFQHRLALETVRPFEKGALKYIGDEEAASRRGSSRATRKPRRSSSSTSSRSAARPRGRWSTASSARPRAPRS
jgi:hypothetical protein